MGGISDIKILLINVIFATFNGFLVNLVCIVNRRDKTASHAVIIGAVVNVVLNTLFIYKLGKEELRLLLFVQR